MSALTPHTAPARTVPVWRYDLPVCWAPVTLWLAREEWLTLARLGDLPKHLTDQIDHECGPSSWCSMDFSAEDAKLIQEAGLAFEIKPVVETEVER